MASYDKDLYKLTRKNVLEGRPKPWMSFAGGALQGALQGWQQGRQQQAAAQIGSQLGMDPSVAQNLDPSVLAGALLRSQQAVREHGWQSDEADVERRLKAEAEQRGYEHDLELERMRSQGSMNRTLIPQIGGAIRWIADRFGPQTPIKESEIEANQAQAAYYRSRAGADAPAQESDDYKAAKEIFMVNQGVNPAVARQFAWHAPAKDYDTQLKVAERTKRYADSAATRERLAQEANQLKRDLDAGKIPLEVYKQEMANWRAKLSAAAQIPTSWGAAESSIGDQIEPPPSFNLNQTQGSPVNPLQSELDKISDPAARAAAIEELRANGVDVTGLR